MTDFAIEELFEGMEEEFTKKEPPVTGHNPVSKTVHYNQAGIECIEARATIAKTSVGTPSKAKGNKMKIVKLNICEMDCLSAQARLYSSLL